MKNIFNGFICYVLGSLLLMGFLSVATMDQGTADIILQNFIIVTVVFSVGTEFKFYIYNRRLFSLLIPWVSFFSPIL